MNHPTKRLFYVISIACCMVLLGCSKSEQAAKPSEPKELTPEQKAARDLQRSNEAVTEIGKKIGRKLEPMDIGVKDKKDGATTAPTAKQ